MATERQIAANRENALKSTGPRTDDGKARSRENALKHGLAGAGVVVAEADGETVRRRLDDWRESFRPATVEDEWLLAQVVVNSVRVDRCQADEPGLRAALRHRASISWDDDRRLEAEVAAAKLARAPALTVLRLRQTSQGCDWLLGRWRSLADALEGGGAWSAAQLALALDLLGTPAEDRAAWEGYGSDPGSTRARTLAAREIDRLERRQAESLVALDAAERVAAEAGRDAVQPRPIALLRRYEAACMRRLQWARRRLPGRPRGEPAPQIPPRADRSAPPPTVATPRTTPAPVAPPTPTPGLSFADPVLSPIRLSDVAPAPAFQSNRRQRRASHRLAARRA